MNYEVGQRVWIPATVTAVCPPAVHVAPIECFPVYAQAPRQPTASVLVALNYNDGNSNIVADSEAFQEFLRGPRHGEPSEPVACDRQIDPHAVGRVFASIARGLPVEIGSEEMSRTAERVDVDA